MLPVGPLRPHCRTAIQNMPTRLRRIRSQTLLPINDNNVMSTSQFAKPVKIWEAVGSLQERWNNFFGTLVGGVPEGY